MAPYQPASVTDYCSARFSKPPSPVLGGAISPGPLDTGGGAGCGCAATGALVTGDALAIGGALTEIGAGAAGGWQFSATWDVRVTLPTLAVIVAPFAELL